MPMQSPNAASAAFLLSRLDLHRHSVMAFDAASLKGSNPGPATWPRSVYASANWTATTVKLRSADRLSARSNNKFARGGTDTARHRGNHEAGKHAFRMVSSGCGGSCPGLVQ